MRILLLADIHANLVALEAVLADAADSSWDKAWALGDTIGYGSEPNECLARLRELNASTLAGNHEAAAIGELPTDKFNPQARAAIDWTAGVLAPENRQYVMAMPLRLEMDRLTLVHGSPRNPVWEYLTSEAAAAANLAHFATQGCLVGHSHVPFLARMDGMKAVLVAPAPHEPLPIGKARYYLNPGSVGQPRDGDPRASYALLDTVKWTVEFHRAQYNVEAAQSGIRAAGLPEILATRLAHGR